MDAVATNEAFFDKLDALGDAVATNEAFSDKLDALGNVGAVDTMSVVRSTMVSADEADDLRRVDVGVMSRHRKMNSTPICVVVVIETPSFSVNTSRVDFM